jgi:flavin-dependent dehydrogenase
VSFKIGEALPPVARRLLQEVGLWDGFVSQGHLPCYGNLSAWGSSELHSTDFIFDPNGLGWHLDRLRFDRLLQQAASEGGVEVCIGAKLNIKACKFSDDSWSISVTNGSERKLSSRWLIDATGRRSTVARAQGVQRHAQDRLVAFFAIFSSRTNGAERSVPAVSIDDDSRTLIESAPDGWWYTALLPLRQRVVVYLTDADLAPKTLCSKRDFLEQLSLTTHISASLRAHNYAMQTEVGVKAVQANSARLASFTGPGWLAVGDAAVSFDPLSSQGILTALFSGLKAAEALNEKLSGGDVSGKGDFSSSDPLVDYSERLSMIYNAYLQNRSTFYAQEKRWVTRPFWRRRYAALL